MPRHTPHHASHPGGQNEIRCHRSRRRASFCVIRLGANGDQAGQDRRRRELLRRRRQADRRPGREGDQHPQQSRPGPASVRGESVGGPGRLGRADRHLQRHRLRPVDGEAARGRPSRPIARRSSSPIWSARRPATTRISGTTRRRCSALAKALADSADRGRSGRHRPDTSSGSAQFEDVAAADPGQDRRAPRSAWPARRSPRPSRSSATCSTRSACRCATRPSSSR